MWGGVRGIGKIKASVPLFEIAFFKLDSFTKITRTLPLEPKGSVEWCWPGHELIMHFTKLPQAFSTSIVPFFSAYFVYFIKVIVKHFIFLIKK